MALETGTFISDLVATNPTGSDPLAFADDHLRLLKSTLKNTFPNVSGAVTKTHTQINTAVDQAADALPKAGGTMTGALVLAGAPSADLQASTKKYVDDLSASVASIYPTKTGGGASGTWGINISGNAATATTATTASNGGVTSVNGSTGAVTVNIVPSSISAIGSVLIAANTSTSNLLPGNTIAGSSLYYPSTITLVGANIYTEGTGAAPNTYLAAGAGKNIMGASERVTSGNTGYTLPGGHTALSGTWRVLSTAAARSSVWDGEINATFSYSPSVMVQRIS